MEKAQFYFEDTKGYHLGKFTSPQNVVFTKSGTLYVTDNNNAQLGSPRVQAFPFSERYRSPSEYIDNNTNVRGYTKSMAKMMLNDYGMPLKTPMGSSILFSDCDNTTGQKVPMKDYIEVTATMHDGHIEKGIAWTFLRFSSSIEIRKYSSGQFEILPS